MKPELLARAVRRWIAPLAVAAVAAVAVAPAHAIYVVGVWDPAYGSKFPDLGWRGSVGVDIPDACKGPPPGVRYRESGRCPSDWRVDEATVEFYRLDDPSMTTLETLDFSDGLFIYDIHIGAAPGYAVGGLGIGLLPGGAVESRERTLSSRGFYFGLQLRMDIVDAESPVPPVTYAELCWAESEENDQRYGEFQGCNEIPAVVRVREQPDLPPAVPVPATGWLVGAALAAAAAFGRRAA